MLSNITAKLVKITNKPFNRNKIWLKDSKNLNIKLLMILKELTKQPKIKDRFK